MVTFVNMVNAFDYMLNNTKKKHITIGILLSMAMLFGGLAVTVMTIENEEGSYVYTP